MKKADKIIFEDTKSIISKINHNKFYLSSSTIGTFGNNLNCGDTYINFDEDVLLKNYDKIKFDEIQGSTWAPHVVSRSLWDKVGGFSEEFFPGAGSDPDFNMKLWNEGVRLFKSLSESRIYHFKSKTLRLTVNIGLCEGPSFFSNLPGLPGTSS